MSTAEPAISVRNLGKRYQLGVIGRQTLQDELRYWWHRARGRNPWEHMAKIQALAGVRPRAETDVANEIWALRDVSFDVSPGEVVGIIGRNGAGKSTLLKILSRITEPTDGEAVINGRVGSLLEVGTGFHPELTGRENVFMNGTILGMKRREVEAKFDEIAAFAEVDAFLDTPVKRYSSGMRVRLAFAVAAHLDPEILMIDEVLAVGDAGFQQKCLGKMGEVASSGRTVLFVSHNMGAIRSLCHRAVLIEGGNLIDDGPPATVVSNYIKKLRELGSLPLAARHDRRGAGKYLLDSVQVLSDGHDVQNHVVAGGRAQFVFSLAEPLDCVDLHFTVYNETGTALAHFDTSEVAGCDHVGRRGVRRLTCMIDELPLAPGAYHANVSLAINRQVADSLPGAFVFHVAEGRMRGRPVRAGKRGVVAIPHQWVDG